MIGTNSYILVITLNINVLKVPIKRQRLAGWIKNMPYLIGKAQETQFKYK